MPTNEKMRLAPLHIFNIGKGCSKISPACKNCFIGKFDSFELFNNWDTLLKTYSFKTGTVFLTSLTTDLFYEGLDYIRDEYWHLVKKHSNCIFEIITKRVERIEECLPSDWEDGYENVLILITAENQAMINYRIPIFEKIKCKHKGICCTPLLEEVDISNFLKTNHYDLIECSGEKGSFSKIRELNIEWVKKLSNQCKENNTRFAFIQAGHKLKVCNSYLKDNDICYFSSMCESFNLNNYVPIIFNLKEEKVIK